MTEPINQKPTVCLQPVVVTVQKWAEGEFLDGYPSPRYICNMPTDMSLSREERHAQIEVGLREILTNVAGCVPVDFVAVGEPKAILSALADTATTIISPDGLFLSDEEIELSLWKAATAALGIGNALNVSEVAVRCSVAADGGIHISGAQAAFLAAHTEALPRQ